MKRVLIFLFLILFCSQSFGAATLKTFLNNNPPQCEDDDLNGFKNENNNLITSSGQTANDADNNQTTKAVAVYSTKGDYYKESAGSIANEYILEASDNLQEVFQLKDGMRIRFKVLHENTGSSNVNVNNIGTKDIKYGDEELLAGTLKYNEKATLVYDEPTDVFNLDYVITGGLFVDVSGNVGIGTANPEAFIEIVADSEAPNIGLTRTGLGARRWKISVDVNGHFKIDDFTEAIPTSAVAVDTSKNMIIYGGIDAGGNGLFVKWSQIFDIGPWDMDTAAIVTFTESFLGVSVNKIIAAHAIIQDDSSFFRYPLTFRGGGGFKLNLSPPQLSLDRTSGGLFDNPSFDTPTGNRGWWYFIFQDTNLNDPY